MTARTEPPELPAVGVDDRTPASKPLPRYRCHKVVEAAKIYEVHVFTETLILEVSPVDMHGRPNPEISRIKVGRKWLAKHDPKAGGYFVRYEDGHTSYSPAEAFESGYTLVE